MFSFCVSTYDKNCNYRLFKSIINQNQLLILCKKHKNIIATQEKLKEYTGN